MLVTLSGIVIEVSFLQSEKALSPMPGHAVWYLDFSQAATAGKDITSNTCQAVRHRDFGQTGTEEKAFAPRIVTPSGIVIVVRLLHL